MAILQSTSFNSTGYLQIPAGTTAQRPTEPAWTVTQFTATGSSTWTCPANVFQIDVLVVAGGGGGGAWVPGGGGGGGVIYRENYPVIPGTVYSYTVGTGGTGSYNPGSYTGMPNATNGGNSVFDTLTAIGGGFGGSWSPYNANSGGSGGGQGYLSLSGPNQGGAGTAGQGFPGGVGNADGTNGYITGGGGGAGGRGEDFFAAGSGENATGTWSQYGKSGDGGPGMPCAITGSVQWYGGGGGGGVHGQGASPNALPGRGGIGGGSNGTAGDATAAAGPTAPNATPNTGGGGGGAGKRGDYSSRGGNGGSGIVVIRYTTGNQSNLRPGAIRLNQATGLEYYLGQGRWHSLAMPFMTRTIINTAYMAGGYKDSVAWSNVNKTNVMNDTTYNLGDGSVARSFNYGHGACSLNIGYVFTAGNAHGTSSNVVTAFNMRTDSSYTGTYQNLSASRYTSGTVWKEHYISWTTGGSSDTSIEEYNMTTETRTNGYTGFTTTAMTGTSGENFGIFFWAEDERVFHYATKTFNTRQSGHISDSPYYKAMHSKGTYAYAASTLRRHNMYSDTTATGGSRPVASASEENHTLGQDWQYMLGMYNGAQNNVSWKWFYATETGFQGNASMEPKGHLGSSSGVCFWRN